MSEWIKCSDRLPVTNGEEIVCWNGKWSRVGCYINSLKHGVTFFSPHDERLIGVTHWMPLPEPPK